MTDQAWPDFYTLPSSPSIKCQDRFGLLDSDDLEVPFWSVLQALLTTRPIASISEFLDVLDSIAVELRGKGLADYDTLRQCLLERETQFLATWPTISRLALSMPRLFPDHQLPVLKPGRTMALNVGPEAVACLVAHQFLATMRAPVWQDGFQNFDIWYPGEQPHASAPRIYITAVLTYFDRIAARRSLFEAGQPGVEYRLLSYNEGSVGSSSLAVVEALERSDVRLTRIELEPMSERTAEPEYLGALDQAVVISANRFIGFGRSATQEEVFVGTTPDACPAVLMTPPLGEGQVMVTTGCEPMVKTVGQARQIKLVGVHDAIAVQGGPLDLAKFPWKGRKMIFMDALELDSFDDSQYPDILRPNVDRELAKALLGFDLDNNRRVYTGLWGCGTFGGDPGVKMLILWLAASFRGCELRVVYEAARSDFASKMREFAAFVSARGDSVSDVLRILRAAEKENIAKGGFLDWALSSNQVTN